MEWLKKEPPWLQVAAKRLLQSRDLAELCQKEANKKFPNIDCNIPASAFDTHDSEKIHLCSISKVAGVNKLPPPNLLDFGTSKYLKVKLKNRPQKQPERLKRQLMLCPRDPQLRGSKKKHQ